MEQNDKRYSILIVDDDRSAREGLERALKDRYECITAMDASTALSILEQREVDIMLTDIRMPDMDGIKLMQKAFARRPELICIMLTAYGNLETTVEAMKYGAFDFLTKPVNLDHLEILIERALETKQITIENIQLKEQLDERYGLESIIGSSPPMIRLFQIIKQASPTQANILIEGESGTGKELVARAIHKLSPRAKAPFIAVHCAALAPTLLESELFGHEKGSFTGAISQRRGRFEIADGGTLFLDEIGEIDPSLQVKLLRVLEERTFERVGGNTPIQVDIRIIAATNADLLSLVKQGKFRDDLYYRLNVVNIKIPPLRERKDDIPILCDYFIKEFNKKNNKQINGITPEALQVLSAYEWPGNVRELRNVIEKMVVLSTSNRLSVRDVPSDIRHAVSEKLKSQKRTENHELSLNLTLEEIEKHAIAEALRRNNYNRTKAAMDLGISRRTLIRKLERYPELDKSAQEQI